MYVCLIGTPAPSVTTRASSNARQRRPRQWLRIEVVADPVAHIILLNARTAEAFAAARTPDHVPPLPPPACALLMICGPFATDATAQAFATVWGGSDDATGTSAMTTVDVALARGHACAARATPPVACYSGTTVARNEDDERTQLGRAMAAAGHAPPVVDAAVGLYDTVRQRCVALTRPPDYLVRYASSRRLWSSAALVDDAEGERAEMAEDDEIRS